MVGKILIVDDVATNRIVLKAKLAMACYQPMLAADGRSCLRLAREALPDLIVLNVRLPDLPGIEVVQALRADPLTADIPVLMLADTGDAATRLAALRAGADDVLVRPVEDVILMARLRNLSRTREAMAELGQRGATLQALGLAEAQAAFEFPGTIALVADRAETTMRWRKDLAAGLGDRVILMSREEALADPVPGQAADIFVVDGTLGGSGGGLRLMSDLRSRSATRHAAVVLIQPQPNPAEIAMAFDMGANDVQPAGLPGAELALRLRRLMRRKQTADRLRASVQDGLRLAVIDPLTGLYNRRYAMPRLAAIAERARRAHGSFAVMVIDLDRFKSVNDHWGHAAGDAVLVEVAHRLGDNLRASDLVARIGGEEFLVALPDAAPADARAMAERLCRVMRDQPILLPDGSALSVTVSIGLAMSDGCGLAQDEAVSQVMERADRALLAAKSEGRNQVMVNHSHA